MSNAFFRRKSDRGVWREFSSCSSMKLTSKGGNPYWFRTCDIGTGIWEDDAHVVSFPVDYEIELTGGMKRIHTNYSILGVTDNLFDTWLLDGINSAGLTGGLLFLKEGTSVEEAEEGYTGVMGMEIVTVLLAGCGTVEDVKREIQKIQILNVPVGETSAAATLHLTFTDAEGRNIILEAADPARPGHMRIYEDYETIGVMTNSPVYEKQLANLSWYLAQSPEMQYGREGEPITSLVIDNTAVRADGRALHEGQTGTFPASYASYDRFVRVSMLKFLNHDGRDFSDSQMLPMGSGIIHAVFEPHNQGIYHYAGFDEHGNPTGKNDSFTQYTVMYNISAPELYIQPYDSTAWTRIGLSECSGTKTEYHKVSHDSMAGVVESSKL